MTLDASEMLNPQPTMVAPGLPRIVLLEVTLSIPEQEIVPDTRMTAAPLADSALVSPEALLTGTVAALPPPVVPPPWVAQPTRPVGFPGGRCHRGGDGRGRLGAARGDEAPLLGRHRVAGVLLDQGAGGGGVVLGVEALAAVGVDYPVVGAGGGEVPGLGGGARAGLLLYGLARGGAGVLNPRALAAVGGLELGAAPGHGPGLAQAAAAALGELDTLGATGSRDGQAQTATVVHQCVVPRGGGGGRGGGDAGHRSRQGQGAATAMTAPAVFLLILYSTVELLAGPAGRCGLRVGVPPASTRRSHMRSAYM